MRGWDEVVVFRLPLFGAARGVVGWGSGGGEPAAEESEGAKTPVRLLDLDGRAGDVGREANGDALGEACLSGGGRDSGLNIGDGDGVDYWDFHWTSWALFIVATFVAIAVAVAVAIVVAIVVAIDLVPQRLVPEVSSLPGVSTSCGENRVECGDGMLIWCGDDHGDIGICVSIGCGDDRVRCGDDRIRCGDNHIWCGDDHGDIGICVSIGCGDDRVRCGDDRIRCGDNHIWCGDNRLRCGDGMPSRCADDLFHHDVDVPIWCADIGVICGVGVPIWCVDNPIYK
ncbi:hypothetical protein GE061_014538 [Apolygus lucorum]|uniref:Uncharacterized protein n=1 Tax=Apolygus lucorum TaxID=248454 RepID=A0A8S9XKL6_APOLU|nr:hypothetical protein GE061_014538 [Apolygus lucorum]